VHDPSLGFVAKGTSISYTLWDVLILASGTRLLSTVRKTPTAVLLFVGCAGMLASDVLYGLKQLDDTWQVGGPVDLGWFVCYAAWGAAALHPSMLSLTATQTVWQNEVTNRRILLLTLSSLIAPAVLLVEAREGDVEHATVIALMSVVIFLLVLLRLVGVVGTHRQAVARERGLREAGAALVSATNVADVVAAVRAAVAKLMRPGTDHRVLLAVDEPHPATDGLTPGTRATAATPDGSTRLVPTSDLGEETAAELGDFGTTLVRPLAVADSLSGESIVGALLVSARKDALVALRGAAEVLGSQASLALERIALSNEINRRNNEEYFRTLVHNTADVILIINDDNRIRYASPSAAAVFRRSLTGVDLGDLVHPDEREAARRLLDLARSGADPIGNDWTVLDADGRRIQVEVSCRDLRDDLTVRGVVVTLRDVTARRNLERELTHRAYHDSLTGLANRVLFQERVQQAVQRPGRDGVVGVLFIDLDDFKVVNDTLGHDIGDQLLVRVAEKLTATLRAGDLAARLGGDEFAALIEDARDTDDVELVAERMVAMFAEPLRLGGGQTHTSASIGVATTADATDATDLLRQADLALYVSKGEGKGRWRRYQSALHTTIVERLELRSELDHAIADDALALSYQPIVSLRDGRTVGFEALVRWHHPTRGLILPTQFIDVAEESGLIVPIGNWVLAKALHTGMEWHDLESHGEPPYVSVNVSARQFRSPGFADRVRRELAEAALPPSALTLEITESLFLRDDDQVWADLAALRRTGIRIAIDDFGTGYSSLSYLRQVPVDIVKIDRSFIDAMSHSSQQRALVEGIVRLADTLGLEVIAEGIERSADRDLLADMGCPFGQGYLFAEPLAAKDAVTWLIKEPVDHA
jgi:diguanylate cyclase (GGDEF)-like protein/PAS domain S-box-containing protein